MKPSCHRYVIGTLELLVAENYMIVYLNGATSRKKMPTVGWLRKCYQQIDRRWVEVPVFTSGAESSRDIFQLIVCCHRLRKNLKSLIIVHPSWFIRTLLALTKPFIRWVFEVISVVKTWYPERSDFWRFLFLFTAPSLVKKSSMCTVWQNWQSWFQWSMWRYQIVSNSKYHPVRCIRSTKYVLT